MKTALDIIQNTQLTYRQQLLGLAACAVNTLNVLNYGKAAEELIEKGVICTLNEGNAPYGPRYVVPNYAKLMTDGCKFLQLNPPKDIWEATHALMIMYQHVHTHSSYPVYLGNLDTLLEPFVRVEEEAYHAIRLFLLHIDRVLTNSFVHANIGPKDTEAGRLILRATEELNCPIPSLTLKYEEGVTSDALLQHSAQVAFKTAKPSFVNHRMNSIDFQTEDYAIVSCYNGFPIGGGAYTMVRMRLNYLAREARSIDDFFDNLFPAAVQSLLGMLDERTRFLVEEAAYFKSNFLLKEGFLDPNLFTSMFGIVGLAEAANILLNAKDRDERYGVNKEADALGLRIIQTLDAFVKKHVAPHVNGYGGHYLLHAQVGIETDNDCSPGCRIPIGEEPELLDQILHSAPFHRYFFNGIGDIYVFEDTYEEHPEALGMIVKGAFQTGVRYLSVYGSNSDVVRVTGYLVKKSDVERLERGEVVGNDAVALAKAAKDNAKAFDRKIQKS